VSGRDPDEIEASLQTAWDADTAAVYADLLSSRGDPRGELIAIDLALAKEHREELLARKRALITTWIGEPTELWRWRPRELRYGLLCRHFGSTNIYNTLPKHLAAAFERVGDRIGELGLHGGSKDIVAAIKMIAARGLPWLSRLHLDRWEGTGPITKSSLASTRGCDAEPARPHRRRQSGRHLAGSSEHSHAAPRWRLGDRVR
jgi:hypothetical protein